ARGRAGREGGDRGARGRVLSSHPCHREEPWGVRRDAPWLAMMAQLSLPSYLKDTLSLVRKASTLPFSITRSCSTTSATRMSLRLREARSIAALAAFSHESLLVPTSSITL